MLGLEEPLGKAVLELIANKALHQTFRLLCQYPRLPTRSTREALLRGANHWHDIRHLLQTPKKIQCHNYFSAKTAETLLRGRDHVVH